MKNLKIKECFLVDCVSFTLVMLALNIIAVNPDWMTTVDRGFIFELLSATTLISAIMYFTSKIPVESQLISTLIYIADIAVVVFSLGGAVYGWFPWELKYIIEVAVILVVAYFITNFILGCQTSILANKINEKIRERKNESHN